MPAKPKERPDAIKVDATGLLAALRFRLFVTIAMRVILIRDNIAMLGRPSSAARSGPGIATTCIVKSGSRRLDGRLTLPVETPAASMLILHGIGERLAYWSAAQELLVRHGIASLLIDYSGYGASQGAVTPTNLRQDVVSAYAELQRLVPMPQPPFVLGLSLGTGVAVDAAPFLHPASSGIILCEPFSSLRDAAIAVCRGLPLLRYFPWLAKLMPDLYRTASTLGSIGAPVLIVHSEADELFPAAMARKIFAAANIEPACKASLAILSGYAHNDAYLRPSSGYWQPILEFVGDVTGAIRAKPDLPGVRRNP